MSTATVETTGPGAVDMSQFVLPPRLALAPRRQLFLGHKMQDGGRRAWTTNLRDSMGIIAPPGYGKTSGLIVPNILSWDGPVISTSTRGDVLHDTGDFRRLIAGREPLQEAVLAELNADVVDDTRAWRRHIADRHGGRIYIYDPLGSEPGVTSIGWSPYTGCADPRVCFRRVAAITSSAGEGMTDGKHWRLGAAAILRGYFQAAALAGVPMATVRRWIARQEVDEPVEILRGDERGVQTWADDLEGMPLLGERERGSFYSVCRAALEATAEPTVLASCDLPSLDIDEFLATKSTLYVVGPAHYQEVTAPLIIGLIDSIVQRAAEIAARNPGGKLADPLLLGLDELPNTAPMKSLPVLVSELGGRGVKTIYAAQSVAALRMRYGADQAQTIISATAAKVIYGGMSSDTDLRNVSGWAGEAREHQLTIYSHQDPRTMGNDGRGQHAIGYQYRPVLPTASIQNMPPFHAWMFYRSDPPVVVQTPPAGLIGTYAQLSGFTADLPDQEQP